jgi:hypothetical protein
MQRPDLVLAVRIPRHESIHHQPQRFPAIVGSVNIMAFRADTDGHRLFGRRRLHSGGLI